MTERSPLPTFNIDRAQCVIDVFYVSYLVINVMILYYSICLLVIEYDIHPIETRTKQLSLARLQ